MRNKDKNSTTQESLQSIDCETPFGQDYFWKELEIIVMDGAEMDIDNKEQT
jgi:hypothetical protein